MPRAARCAARTPGPTDARRERLRRGDRWPTGRSPTGGWARRAARPSPTSRSGRSTGRTSGRRPSGRPGPSSATTPRSASTGRRSTSTSRTRTSSIGRYGRRATSSGSAGPGTSRPATPTCSSKGSQVGLDSTTPTRSCSTTTAGSPPRRPRRFGGDTGWHHLVAVHDLGGNEAEQALRRRRRTGRQRHEQQLRRPTAIRSRSGATSAHRTTSRASSTRWRSTARP